MARRLCLISLVYILLVAFSVYSPWDLTGAYTMAKSCDMALSNGEWVTATGQLVKKEIKNDQTVYYIKNATVCCEDGQLNKTSFLFKFDSDTIPLKSTIKIKAKVKFFENARNEGAFDMKDYYNSLGYYFELTDINLIDIKGFVFFGRGGSCAGCLRPTCVCCLHGSIQIPQKSRHKLPS